MNNVRPSPCCVLPSLVNDHLSMNNIRPQPCQMQPPPSRVRRSQIFPHPFRVNSIPAVSGTSPRQKHQLDLGWRIAARHPIDRQRTRRRRHQTLADSRPRYLKHQPPMRRRSPKTQNRPQTRLRQISGRKNIPRKYRRIADVTPVLA